MKPPVLALSVAAAAFAASSIYLWQQLGVERGRAAQVEANAAQLQARIAELEKARAQFLQVRNSSTGPVVSGAFANAAPSVPATVPAPESENGWSTLNPAARNPAMDKMMRWQIRAEQKRMYAGVGAELGLGKEDAARLVDLLTQQQMTFFGVIDDLPWDTASAEGQIRMREKQLADQAEIDALLGPEKARALKEYQQSLPARQEFEVLVRQLEGNDVTLSAEQSRKLLAAYLEERKRVPMPEYDGVMDGAAYQKSVFDWQENYANRMLDEARSILDARQLDAFNEVQDWQKEMRSQFSTVTFSTGPGGAIGLESQSVGFASATAVSVPASAVLVAPEPRPRDPSRER